jgi:hypothetical protein
MKTTLPSFLLMIPLIAGCRERNQVVWIGNEGFTFNGVEIELPNSGKGQYDATPKQLDFRWESKALTIRDRGDETVAVTTPVVSDRIIEKSVVIVIDPKGNISTRTPKETDKNQNPNKARHSNPH